MRQLAAALILGLLPSAAAAQGRFASAINIGRIDSVQSKVLSEQRHYLVYTPPSYRDSTVAPQRYPVLYLLDGDAHFHSVSGLVQILGTGVNGTYVVPEMIVVAIPNTNRMRDMSPTKATTGPDGKPQPAFANTGGMGNFLSFIRDELIPDVEQKYRTMSYRVFVGHSLGGITTINALYTMPEAFNAYVAIDPSLWWDNSTLLKQLKSRIASARWDQRALYVAQANTLSPDDSVTNSHFGGITQFDATMKAYNNTGLRYSFRYYDGDDHGSVPLISEYDALRFIFDGYKLPVQRVVSEPRSIIAHYERISARLGQTFTPSEAQLRLLGTIAMQQDAGKAMEFHRIATELYPASWRAWDQLGIAALARRDTTRARMALEESLKRNPSNAATKSRLASLNGARAHE